VTMSPGPAPLRVTFVEPYPDRFGGSHQVTMLLAQALQARLVAVHVTTPGVGPLTDRLSARGVPWSVTTLPASLMLYGHQTRRWKAVKAFVRLPATWFRLFRELRGTTDLLHVNNLRGMLLLAPSARAAGIPVVWHVHTADHRQIANRIAAALASAIVAPSAAVAQELRGVRPDRIEIVQNCAPPDATELVTMEPRDPNLIVTATRITPEKGLDILLESLALVVRDEPWVRLRVFGSTHDGYEDFARQVKQKVTTLNLEGKVEFMGEVERPYRHWLDAAVYVQPSRSEILPMAILEAMAVGLPVVATGVGGVTDLVDHGVTGLLVPPEDPGQLAEAILKLVRDPDMAIRMGSAARLRATHFGLSKMTDRILGVYSAVGAGCRR
jgi:glycosyltransferase involved in cell wall biosynthesis